jgi:hypothetical protein
MEVRGAPRKALATRRQLASSHRVGLITVALLSGARREFLHSTDPAAREQRTSREVSEAGSLGRRGQQCQGELISFF